MASLSILSLVSFFDEEVKSIEKGENHVRSDHVEALSYSAGVLRGEIYASTKQKRYKVTVCSDASFCDLSLLLMLGFGS